MRSYADLKQWFDENKQVAVLAGCFVLVFLVGFGSGRYWGNENFAENKKQPYYSTKVSPIQNSEQKPKAAAAIATSSADSCLIKGNINTKGNKIYHVPGGAFYKLVKPEQCFLDESAAQQAGFIRSSR